MTPEEIKRAGFDAYFVDHTAGVYPTSASGSPWNAATIAVTGDVLADLNEDLAAEQKARELKDKVIVVKAKCGSAGRLYGSITGQEIADALREQHGVDIDKRKIDLKEPIRELGNVQVNVWIYPNITTRMTVRVCEADK